MSVGCIETGHFPAVDLHDKAAQNPPDCIYTCCYISCADHVKMHLRAFPVERTRAVFISEKSASIPDVGVTCRNERARILNLKKGSRNNNTGKQN